MKKSLLFIRVMILSSLLMACSKMPMSIYQGLPEDADGVLAVDVGEDYRFPAQSDVLPELPDELSPAERTIAIERHAGQFSRFGFMVVDASNDQLVRSYRPRQARRLASVTKISTAIAALENVNANVAKVRTMLKTSNNGEASRYARLAAKNISGYITPGNGYSVAHSCPNEILNEVKTGAVILDWLKDQIQGVDWSDASLNDGAGCHYNNFMSPLQIVHILRYAAKKGDAYAGQSFEELLSISGVDGTWRNYNTDAKGRVLAKTGTLNPNSNLSGYFYAKRDGELKQYYFSVLVEKDPGSANTKKARLFIEALVRHWIHTFSQSEGPSLGEV